MPSLRRMPLLWTALLVVFVLAACGDDEDPRVLFSDPPTPDPELDNLWPNEDGRAWFYDMQQWERDDLTLPEYDTRGQVPDAPSLDQVAPWVDVRPLMLAPDDRSTGAYRLKFDGEVTTESGVTSQNLLETLYSEQGDAIREFSLLTAEQNFLMMLAELRPDLRAKIHAAHPELAGMDKAGWLFRPTLLSGYAWEKTEEYIGSYADVGQDLSWLYLESEVAVGHEFSFQLIPSLADDVFLHARVLRQRDVLTEIGKLEKTLEVVYLIDMGVAEATDITGEPLFYSRPLTFGAIAYAPTVGPVAMTERAMLGWTEDGPTDPGIAWDLQIMGVSPGSGIEPIDE